MKMNLTSWNVEPQGPASAIEHGCLVPYHASIMLAALQTIVFLLSVIQMALGRYYTYEV